MPRLEIYTKYGNVDHVGVIDTLGAMLFPEDCKGRESFVLRNRERVISLQDQQLRRHGADPLKIPPLNSGNLLIELCQPFGGLTALQSAPSLKEIEKGLPRRHWAGSIAGLILILVLWMDQVGLRGSLKKARAIVVDLKKEQEVGFGKSPRSIETAWTRFRSVAHLWAAWEWWRIRRESLVAAGKPDVGDPLSQRAVESFLAISAWFLQKGQEHFSQGRSAPLLDPESVWTIPEELDDLPTGIEFGPLPRAALETLCREYPGSVPSDLNAS